MERNEQGMLYAFRMSGVRMRQSAAALRRQGQVLDALTMIRRAAEQEDTSDAWLALAVELRSLGCWEAAAQVLGRVLSAESHASGAWLEMGRCLSALGQGALAQDCLYHQLHEDPWSSEGDAARALLMDMEMEPEGREPHRAQLLIRNGVRDWSSGNRQRGERRIRRALKIVRDRKRLLSTAAMMCMLERDFADAQKYLTRAARRDPDDSRTLTALSVLHHQMGQPDLARDFLKKAVQHCDTVMAEDGILTAAWAQDAWAELSVFLDARMKLYPWRIPLLSAKAAMRYETGDTAGAQETWRTVLAIDPEDRQAGAMMSASQREGESPVAVPGMLPVSERRRQLAEMQALTESDAPLSELLRHASRSRRLIDWCMSSGDAQENRLAVQLLSARDEASLIPYLRELVARPFLRMEARQWALIRLAEMGCLDEMTMPAGNRYTTVQCQRISEKKQRSTWRIFLPGLLEENARLRMGAETVEFAAKVWRCMSSRQRMEAVGSGRYVWCKAMQLLWLHSIGMKTLALVILKRSPVSRRRVSRVLRRLAECMNSIPIDERRPGPSGEGDT